MLSYSVLRRAARTLVGALLAALLVAAPAPAGAAVVALANTDALVFNRANATNIVGDGKTVGNIVLYKAVGTYGGYTIDCAVTTVALSGSISDYDNPGSAATGGTSANNFQLNTVGGYVTVNLAFYEAGTYTGANTGVPITLANVKISSIDLDSSSSTGSYQYSDFSGFQGYQMMADTSLAVQPQAASGGLPARVRFITTKAGSRSNVPQDQVLVRYDAVQALTVTFGNVVTGSTNYFGLVFGAWPATSTPVNYTNYYNTPPTSADTSMYVGANAASLIPSTSFAFSDADGNPFYSIKIATLPGAGSLEYYNGSAWVAVIAGQVISTSDLVGGKLRFTGAATTSFTFAVNDSLDFSTSTYTFTLNQATNTQTITFANPGSKAPNSVAFSSGATASSGLVVTLTSSTTGVCTVNNNATPPTITPLANGTCVVTATQQGDSSYGAATPVTQSFPVSSLTAQTITFANPGSKTTSQSPVASGATASSGLTVVLASLTPTVCSVSGLDIILLAVGECTIRATQPGNGSYAPAVAVDQTFSVTPGNALVTTTSATSVTASSATLNGTVNSFGASAVVSFCVSASNSVTNGALGACTSFTAAQSPVVSSTASAVTASATNLTDGQTYYFQTIAVANNTTVYGNVQSFTASSATPPVAVTLAISAMSKNSNWFATLNGSVSVSQSTNVTFCWVRTTSTPVVTNGVLGSCTTVNATQSPVANGSAVAVNTASIDLGTSKTGRAVYYQVIATTAANASEKSYGAVRKFVTGSPVTETTAQTNLASTSATLNGWMNFNSSLSPSTTYLAFCYGTTSANTYGALTTCTKTTNSAVTQSGNQTRSANVTGLIPNKTYYYQTVAIGKTSTSSSTTYTGYGSILSFTTPIAVTAPTVTTSAATSVIGTSATINGLVNPNSGTAATSFTYCTDAAMSANCVTTTAAPTGLTGTTAQAISLSLSSLQNSTTYYFRASATNATGTTTGSVLKFTTGAPVAFTTSATLVTGTSATLNGAVKAQDDALSTSNSFCYVRTAAPSITSGVLGGCTSATPTPSTASGWATTPLSLDLTGLTPNSTYYFQTVATKVVGQTTLYAYGDVLSFVTAAPPIATTTSASSVTAATATLNGTVNPNGATTIPTFCYAVVNATTDGLLDNCVVVEGSPASISAASTGTAVAVSAAISGLTAARTYYFQVIGDNERGTSYGSVLNFTTGFAIPTAVTVGSLVGATTATLYGTGAAGGDSAAVSFRVSSSSSTTNGLLDGTQINVGSATPTPIAGVTAVSAQATTTGALSAGQTYYYQIVVTNSVGTALGAVMQFVAGAPTVTTVAATSIGSTTATLNGTVNPNSSDVTAIQLCYSTDSTFTAPAATCVNASPYTLVSSTTTTSVAATTVVALAQGTTYYFYASATSARGTSVGEVLQFTTSAPIAVTNAATSIGAHTATLNGTVDANNSGLTAVATYCISSDLTAVGGALASCLDAVMFTPEATNVTANSATSVPIQVADLDGSSTYYFQTIATAGALQTYGAVLSFSTAPNVHTELAGNIAATSATVTGTASEVLTTPKFCYSTADPGAAFTAASCTSLPATGSFQGYAAALASLTANTLYYYELVGQVGGTWYSGGVATFTTLAAPAVAATYSVTYDGNSSTGGSVPLDATAYANGATVTVASNSGSLVRSGYTFAGWNTAANGGGTDYAAAATFAIGAANVTLYAKWTVNAPVIIYMNQTINFPVLPNITLGDPAPVPGATVSSGLPVTYTASGACTVTPDGVITITGAGVCTITASQAGGSVGGYEYLPATASRSFTVYELPQSITFAPLADVVWGDAAPVLEVTATSGLPITYTATGACTVDAAGHVTITGIGVCSVTASQAGGTNNGHGYAPATPITRSFRVSAASITIIAVVQTRVYDRTTTASWVSQPSMRGVRGTDVITLVIPAIQFASANVGATVVVSGSFTITGTNAANYVVTQPTLSATITSAPLRVVAMDTLKLGWLAEPEYTYTLDGCILGDVCDVTGVTFSREAGNTAGKYALFTNVSHAVSSNANYVLVPVNAVVTIVGRAIPTITAKAPTYTYGAALPGAPVTGTATDGKNPVAGTWTTTCVGITAGVLPAVGTYACTATFTPADVTVYYTPDPVAVQLTIAPAPLTLTIANAKKFRTQADPQFTFAAQPLVNGDAPSAIKVAYTRAPGEAAGTYAINATAMAANYTVTVVPGVLTIAEIPVAPAPATYTPKSVTSTTVKWVAVAYADSYVVQVAGVDQCTSTGTSCNVPTMVGPSANVTVTALADNGAIKSAPAQATYVSTGKAIIVVTVYFDENKYNLDATDKAALLNAVNVVKAQGFDHVYITGHTDGQGGAKNAINLGKQRAQSTGNFLDEYLDVTLTSKSFGETDPAASNATKAGQAKNRRAVVYIQT